MAIIFLRDGDLYRLAAQQWLLARGSRVCEATSDRVQDVAALVARTALEAGPVHIPDVLADPEYDAAGGSATCGFRTMLGVPLLREGTPIGVIGYDASERRSHYRQADRAGANFRRPGGDRHRERAAVRRGAAAHRGSERIAAAADRHRRRAQGHQPLDVRSCRPCSIRWWNRRRGCARPIRRPSACRKDDGYRHRAPSYGIPLDYIEAMRAAPLRPGARHGDRARIAREANGPYSRCPTPTPNSRVTRHPESAGVCARSSGVPLMREGRADRRHLL